MTCDQTLPLGGPTALPSSRPSPSTSPHLLLATTIPLLSLPVRAPIPSSTASSGNVAKQMKVLRKILGTLGWTEWKRKEKEKERAVNWRPAKATLTISFLHYLLPGSCSCSDTFIPDINSPYLQLQEPREHALVCCIWPGKSVLLGFLLP